MFIKILCTRVNDVPAFWPAVDALWTLHRYTDARRTRADFSSGTENDMFHTNEFHNKEQSDDFFINAFVAPKKAMRRQFFLRSTIDSIVLTQI